jgi:hypothetical protein
MLEQFKVLLLNRTNKVIGISLEQKWGKNHQINEISFCKVRENLCKECLKIRKPATYKQVKWSNVRQEFPN